MSFTNEKLFKITQFHNSENDQSWMVQIFELLTQVNLKLFQNLQLVETNCESIKALISLLSNNIHFRKILGQLTKQKRHIY